MKKAIEIINKASVNGFNYAFIPELQWHEVAELRKSYDYFIHHGFSYVFEFVHKDYDGAPDANDSRLGGGKSIEDCIEQIEEQIKDTL